MSVPQADASTLVDRAELERQVQEMYRSVARDPLAPRHFETGRNLALRLGYPESLLAPVPYLALASFAGVGYHLDLADLRPGDRVLDLGSGSGMDAFCAATSVGRTGRVVGVDFTDAQIANARTLAERNGFDSVSFVEASIDRLPFDDASFDVVISNGVINLSPVKDRVFAEAARVLRPGGRIAIADIVSATPLKERTRRNTELWAACIAGAIPSTTYLDELVEAGFTITETRPNDYRFITERALDACQTYGVESVSIAATRRGANGGPSPTTTRRLRRHANAHEPRSAPAVRPRPAATAAGRGGRPQARRPDADTQPDRPVPAAGGRVGKALTQRN